MKWFPRPQRLSLRGRLLWTFLVPLAVVLLLVGVVSTTTLRGQLIGQVDPRLNAALSRSADADGGYGPPPVGRTSGDADHDSATGGPEFLGARGQGAGTLGARVVAGRTRESGVNTERGQVQQLTADQKALVATVDGDGDPETVDLGGNLGSYRLAAATTPHGEVIVTGLPLSSADSAVSDLVTVEVLAGLCGLLVAALAGVVVL